jgi:hypothetical protein
MEEGDRVITLDPHPNGKEGVDLSTRSAAVPEAPTVVEPQQSESLPVEQKPKDSKPADQPSSARPKWIVPAGIGLAGLVVSGVLGALLWTTIGDRNRTQDQLDTTKASLAGKVTQLKAAQVDIAARKADGAYTSFVVRDTGRVMTDYESMVSCKAYSDCRAAAQQMLEDLQGFQSDRAGATVPDNLQSGDGSLRDSLSAAIAGQQELIVGMDDSDIAKIKDGGKKVDQAIQSIGKAEISLASELG